jgi:uncharacterized protein YigE (DUF2233 family)
VIRQAATLLIWGVAALALRGSENRSQSRTYRNPVKPACALTRFDGSAFTVCRFDPARHQIQLIDTGRDGKPLRNFEGLRHFLGEDARRVAFAMNAGMYDWNGLPIGLYVEDSVERHAVNRRDGAGNFHLKPNGIFWIDQQGAHVADTEAFAASNPASVIWATQSGPMLIINGKIHPKLTDDGASRYVRNGVGVDRSGALIFAISDERVSLGKTARLFRDQLRCENALFLDGYVSSLWDGASGRNDQDLNIGPMVVVSEKGAFAGDQ